jgi:UDP:flavonoid glycosyltransferase YjiC (YdhE family)
MRILVTSTPGIGHIHPIVPLATELRSAGHEVVWATALESCATVERFGFRAIAAGLESPERKARFAARAEHIRLWPLRLRRTIALPLMFGEIAAPAMHDDLKSVFDDVRPQLVVHDLAEFAAAPMAIARGLPQVTFGYSGALSNDLAARVLDSVAPVWARERVRPTLHGLNGDLLLHAFPTSMDAPRQDGPSAPIRPLAVGGPMPESPPDWIGSFGVERPGAYVTFGTETARAAPWAAIIEAIAGLDVDVVATVGGRIDPAETGPLPSNMRVERFVPQRFVLERAAVVVSHAGAGTLIGAAAAGRVQLCLPLVADQWENADLLAAAGAGITLEEDQRSAATIRSQIERLLTDATIRAAAARVETDFAGMPHPRELVEVIAKLVP